MRRLSKISPGLSFIIRLVWFFGLAFVSWRLTNWLLFESGFMTVETVYSGGVSRDLPEELIVVGVSLLIFLIINCLIWIGYFFSVPSGRRRPTTATTYSRNPELYR